MVSQPCSRELHGNREPSCFYQVTIDVDRRCPLKLVELSRRLNLSGEPIAAWEDFGT